MNSAKNNQSGGAPPIQRKDKERSFLEDGLLTNVSANAVFSGEDNNRIDSGVFLKSLDGYLNYFTQNIMENSTSGQSLSGLSNIFTDKSEARNIKKLLNDLVKAQKELKHAHYEIEKYKFQLSEYKNMEFTLQERFKILRRKQTKEFEHVILFSR